MSDRDATEELLKRILRRNHDELDRLVALTEATGFNPAAENCRAVLADIGTVESRLLTAVSLIGHAPRDVAADRRLAAIADAIARIDLDATPAYRDADDG